MSRKNILSFELTQMDAQNLISFIKQENEDLKSFLANQFGSKSKKLSDEWLTKEEVMQILKISPRKLQTLRDNGTMPYSQIDGKIYYKRSDLESLLDSSYNKK